MGKLALAEWILFDALRYPRPFLSAHISLDQVDFTYSHSTTVRHFVPRL